tara:strand:- start:671 stop:856 length:186 start_codon:yes stop_codon:yes gene_type:complete
LGLAADRSLKIGELVAEVTEEIEVLEEENIIDEEKSDDLENQLKKVEREGDRGVHAGLRGG